jgi:hypothetical protein
VPRFPALEPEPPPRSFLRRLGRGLVVPAVAAAVVLGAVTVPSALGRTTGPASRPSATAMPVVPGRLVVIDGQHLAVTDARGKLLHPLTRDLRIDPQVATVVPDPTLRRAVTGPGLTFGAPTGQLVRLDAETVHAPSVVPADLLRHAGLADEPWTDRGTAVVLVSGDRAATVGVVDLASGRLTPLGTAAAAAGIPDTRAVVVATGGAALPEVEGAFVGSTSTRIEVRAPGRPTVVLTQLRDLARQAHLPPTDALVVDRISVSPDGRHILVGYDRASSHEFPQGFANRPRLEPAGVLVVMDRSGRVEGIRPSEVGRRLVWARWSGADALALGESATTETINTDEMVLSTWDRSRVPDRIDIAGAFDNALRSPCVWSPRSDHLMCGDDRGWYDVEAASRKVTAVPGVTGRPVIWLP